MKHLLISASILLLVGAVTTAHADTVTYSVSVNTSSQSGNGGYIDLGLNAGTLGAQDITATVTGFSGATLNPGDPNNDAINTTGSLPGEVDFDNQSFNDYFEALTFGNELDFTVTLSGPGVSTGGASTSDSGTIFQVSFLDPAIQNFLFTNDPNGVAAQIDLDASGTVSASSAPGTTVAPPAATPEPATLSLVGLAGVLGFAVWRKKAWAV